MSVAVMFAVAEVLFDTTTYTLVPTFQVRRDLDGEIATISCHAILPLDATPQQIKTAIVDCIIAKSEQEMPGTGLTSQDITLFDFQRG